MVTHCQCTHGRDIPTLPSLRLDDKHPVPTRRSALLDRITRVHERVQARVTPQTELGQRRIVLGRRGEVCHQNVEQRVQFARVVEGEQRAERFEPADEHERMHAIFLETGEDGTEVDAGEGAVRRHCRLEDRGNRCVWRVVCVLA